MSTIFMFSALVGGTCLFCQLVMTLVGLGHGGADVDATHDLSHALSGQIGDALPSDVDHDPQVSDHHGASWLFGIISFRTLAAATTVFGLAGMTAFSGGLSLLPQVLIAVIGGGAAMFSVNWLMRFLYQLGQSGTLRIKNSIGKIATVSIPIPGNNSGRGKVRLTVQGRLEELAAVSSTAETLATGAEVIVIDVVDGNLLEVAPWHGFI